MDLGRGFALERRQGAALREKCAGRTCVSDERVTEDSTCTTHFDEGVETRLLR